MADFLSLFVFFKTLLLIIDIIPARERLLVLSRSTGTPWLAHLVSLCPCVLQAITSALANATNAQAVRQGLAA